MKQKIGIIGIVLVLILAVGCAETGKKAPAQLAEEYTEKAQNFEAQGNLIEAQEQYKLALTVDPENQLAKEKSTVIEQELHKRAEEHYQIGLKFYNQGQYRDARKEFLTALRHNPDHADAKDKLTATKKEIEHVTGYIEHTLQPNETISTLADKYYGDYRKFHLIAEYNELEDATKVAVGQQIKIPVIEGIPIIADPASIQTDTDKDSETLPAEIITVKRYITHTVQPEETLSKLAQMYYGDLKKYDVIAKFNNLEEVTPLRVGQELKIPEVEGLPFFAESQGEEAKMASVPPKTPEPEKEAKQQIEEAIDKKQMAIEDQAINYRELGIELFKNKEYQAAITEFQKVLNVKPDDSITREYLAKSHFQQGLIHFGKEDYLVARDEFKAALQYDKDCDKCEENILKCEDTYKEVHYDKGLAYFGEQKLADAIAEWEMVHSLDPNYKDVSKNLTKAKNLLERLEKIKRSKAQENKQ
jgi:tetratricopeptide (TPR) repeat protein